MLDLFVGEPGPHDPRTFSYGLAGRWCLRPAVDQAGGVPGLFHRLGGVVYGLRRRSCVSLVSAWAFCCPTTNNLNHRLDTLALDGNRGFVGYIALAVE